MTDYNYDARIPAGYYDEIYQRGFGVQYWWHHLKFSAVANQIPPSNRWLDIGCGPGTFLGNFKVGNESIGLDFSAPQIDYANRIYGTANRSFVTSTLEELIAGGEKFDAISIIEVIEHLPYSTVDQLLVQMSQLLNPSGCVVLTTPNYRSLWPLIELGVNAISPVSYKDQHINKYTPGKLQRQMDRLYDTRLSTVVGLAPFLAAISDNLVSPANELGASFLHFGMGNIILATGRLKLTAKLHSL